MISGKKQSPVTRGKPRIGVSRGAVAAASVAAVAASGIGAAGAEAAGGKIFACYSKSSKVLQHATSKHCKKGFKSVSWSKAGVMGPQGAQGAAGARGPQGAPGAQGGAAAVAGYAGYHSAHSITSVKFIPSRASAVVASFTPATAGDYAVHGNAFLVGSTLFRCNERNASHSSSFVPFGYDGGEGTIGTNGILHGAPGSPIEEVCSTASSSALVPTAAVTGTQLSAAHVSAAARAHAKRSARAQNWFHPRHQQHFKK